MSKKKALVAFFALSAMLTSWVCFSAEEGAESKFRILDGKEKSFVVCGYSTSFQWRAMLQEKLDRMTGGKRVYHVLNAVAPGSPVSRWIDVKAGMPRRPYNIMLQRFFGKETGEKMPASGRRQRNTSRNAPKPTIALCQQSLQGIERTDGRRAPCRMARRNFKRTATPLLQASSNLRLPRSP